MLWYLQPNHYTDGLQSTEPLTLSSPSVWESQTSFPATWKKTANYRLRHWETENKLEHQVQGESLTTHDRPVVSHGAQHRLLKLLPNQSGVKMNNAVHWEKLSVPFSILPLMWKCLTVLIKLPPLQRKQISSAAARLKVASCFVFLSSSGTFKDSGFVVSLQLTGSRLIMRSMPAAIQSYTENATG